MKVGKWLIGRNGNHNLGITDKDVLRIATNQTMQLKSLGKNVEMRLVGITSQGPMVWTLDQEIKEMKGHVFGLVRTKYGRNMLDAKKMYFAAIQRFQ